MRNARRCQLSDTGALALKLEASALGAESSHYVRDPRMVGLVCEQ